MRVLLSDISYHDLGLGVDTMVLLSMALVVLLVGGYSFEKIQD
jgi:hypothetical protein